MSLDRQWWWWRLVGLAGGAVLFVVGIWQRSGEWLLLAVILVASNVLVQVLDHYINVRCGRR